MDTALITRTASAARVIGFKAAVDSPASSRVRQNYLCASHRSTQKTYDSEIKKNDAIRTVTMIVLFGLNVKLIINNSAEPIVIYMLTM
jgi:hypothetical protein